MASPIHAPKPADLLERVNATSPAITALASSLAPQSVSPMAPSTSNINLSMAMGVGGMPKGKSTTKTHTGMNGGRWTEQEHQSFLAGLRLYGREWKKVASKIKTRTSAQIRSHAQKYFAKLARDEETREGSSGSNTPNSYGYFSDGGSSAVNSGDEGADTDSSLSVRTSQRPMGSKKDVTVLPYPSDINSFKHKGFGKKRSRSPPPGHTSSSYTSTTPIKPAGGYQHMPFKHRKLSPEAQEVDLLPSQEELLEKVSPNIRQRLSSLIDAEICALQVLSCYALLQRQDHRQHQPSHQPIKPQRSVLPNGAGASVFQTNGGMKMSMLATNRLASTSSIC
ncbi:TPA: hypothetical protein N0F65_006109 [Lagenidium giganteum]|uniref:Uncharacterized protein n=1 Tax=Lagenidium giganteum TaxID=4803 RepID=A0AAV2Z4B1_9STRA|nr:TPA: hypothetical protein N0F65_006109 [Lagenidium giganteum]